MLSIQDFSRHLELVCDTVFQQYDNLYGFGRVFSVLSNPLSGVLPSAVFSSALPALRSLFFFLPLTLFCFLSLSLSMCFFLFLSVSRVCARACVLFLFFFSFPSTCPLTSIPRIALLGISEVLSRIQEPASSLMDGSAILFHLVSLCLFPLLLYCALTSSILSCNIPSSIRSLDARLYIPRLNSHVRTKCVYRNVVHRFNPLHLHYTIIFIIKNTEKFDCIHVAFDQ